MSSENIQLLVEKAKNGDKEAFGELYGLYSLEMYKFALWYLSDRFLAEDAVSEAAMNAFISIKKLRKPEKFKSWLFTILLRCCQRQLSHIIGMRSVVEADSLNEKTDYFSVEESVEIKNALYQLSAEDREILLLSALGNLTSKEIGEMLSMPPGTVRSKLSRATDRLYDILSERSVKNGK